VRGRRSFAAAATVSATACALALGLAIAPASPSSGSSAAAGVIAGSYEIGSISRGELVPAASTVFGPGASARRADPKLRRVRLRYYIGAEPQAVAPGVAQLFEIGCPHRAERPVTGGSFASLPGLVVVNSSRTNPQPGLPTAKRAWYEAVVNITAETLQWKPFVTCARSE
jgi:hypothetical protein